MIKSLSAWSSALDLARFFPMISVLRLRVDFMLIPAPPQQACLCAGGGAVAGVGGGGVVVQSYCPSRGAWEIEAGATMNCKFSFVPCTREIKKDQEVQRAGWSPGENRQSPDRPTLAIPRDVTADQRPRRSQAAQGMKAMPGSTCR